ncbi:MAG: hypothetical protein L6R40_002372 [Gallowayella cf. fulva]|nr:MAG: hypothetical protein L6R40_002372 [Xanthomendoza cf. fulva]
MHLSIAALASLLALCANAAPQKPADILDSENPRTPDKCGPLKQDTANDPKDSCISRPPIVTSAAPFGILSFPYSNISETPPPTGYKADFSSCNATIMQTCHLMAARDTAAGAWHFSTSLVRDPQGTNSGQACQIGFWLPRDAIGPIKSERSDPKAAPKPSEHQCQNILNATLAALVNNRTRRDPSVVGASINLKEFPTNQEGQWKTSEYLDARGSEEDVEHSTGRSNILPFPPAPTPPKSPSTSLTQPQASPPPQPTLPTFSTATHFPSPQAHASPPTDPLAPAAPTAKPARHHANTPTGRTANAAPMGKRA